MKIKVGNKIYDSGFEPIMVILSEGDKRNISNMHPDSNRYCVYPDKEEWIKNDYEKIKEWMEIGEEETDIVPKKPKNLKNPEPEKKKEMIGDKEIVGIATVEKWYAKLDKPCQSMWTDFGHPMCRKQYQCFILNENLTCPEGRILKEKRNEETIV